MTLKCLMGLLLIVLAKPCFGLGRVGITMPFRLFHGRVLLAMMMTLLTRICSIIILSSPCPDTNEVSPNSLIVMVLSCLQAFPKGTSPGASKLCAQHLLDAIAGSIVPSACDCLLSLTRLMNHLLSGKDPSCLAPWLCGTPLTALLKREGPGCLPNCCG